eukprot:1209456-Pleurochrysis_carterae.AAC.1
MYLMSPQLSSSKGTHQVPAAQWFVNKLHMQRRLQGSATNTTSMDSIDGLDGLADSIDDACAGVCVHRRVRAHACACAGVCEPWRLLAQAC